jgi:hypothetical protein
MPDLNGNVITIHPMNHDFYVVGAEGDMKIALTDDKGRFWFMPVNAINRIAEEKQLWQLRPV